MKLDLMLNLDGLVLLLTGLTAIYLLYYFYQRYQAKKALYDVYYMMGFVVLLVSGLLLIFFGWGILESPYVLTVATLIPLGISMGLMNQFQPKYKKIYVLLVCTGWTAGNWRYQHRGHGLEKCGRTRISWCGWFDHFRFAAV